MNVADYNTSLIFLVSFVMLIWFDSDIVRTIGNMTKLTKKFLLIDEYVEYLNKVDNLSSYPNFLYGKYYKPIFKLLSCSICLCFWLTIVGLTILSFAINLNIKTTMFLFPINYIFSLTIYLLINKLL